LFCLHKKMEKLMLNQKAQGRGLEMPCATDVVSQLVCSAICTQAFPYTKAVFQDKSISYLLPCNDESTKNTNQRSLFCSINAFI
jgi:hypothetical protein